MSIAVLFDQFQFAHSCGWLFINWEICSPFLTRLSSLLCFCFFLPQTSFDLLILKLGWKIDFQVAQKMLFQICLYRPVAPNVRVKSSEGWILRAFVQPFPDFLF